MFLSICNVIDNFLGFPGGSIGEESAYNAEDMGLIPESGRSPRGGNGNPLQYFAWIISWTEELGGLPSMQWQRVGHNWVTEHEHKMTFHMRSCVRMMNWLRANKALASESQSQAKGSNCSHFCIPHPMICFPCSLLQSTSLELTESKQITWPRRHVTLEVSSPLYAGTEHQTKQLN